MASADLESIVRYIAKDNPEAAAAIGWGVYQRLEILTKHPEAGSFLDELQHQGWRKLIYRRWKIIYVVRERAVIIGRVWPAAMGEANLEEPL